MTDDVRIGVIGCGGIAGAHLNGYKTLYEKGMQGFTVAATCDPVKESAERFASDVEAFQGTRPEVYTDVEAMLEQEQLHGADICSPHGLHHVIAIQCLDAGLHVMVEKPIGVTIKASKAIQAAAARNDRFASTAENCRRYLGQRAVEWAINTGKLLGDIRMFFAVSVGWNDPTQEQAWHWRVDPYLGGCGMVMDSGAHWVDTLRYFFGEVETVYARTGRYDRRMLNHSERGPVEDMREDTWTSILTFKNGLVGTWAYTIAAPGQAGTLVSFHGSEGSVEHPGEVFHPFAFSENARVVRKDGAVITLPELKQMYLDTLSTEDKERLFPYGIYDGFVLEVHDFIDAIQSQRDPEISVDEGLRSKAISEAIYESAWIGEVVRVDDVLAGTIEGHQKAINEHWGL